MLYSLGCFSEKNKEVVNNDINFVRNLGCFFVIVNTDTKTISCFRKYELELIKENYLKNEKIKNIGFSYTTHKIYKWNNVLHTDEVDYLGFEHNRHIFSIKKDGYVIEHIIDAAQFYWNGISFESVYDSCKTGIVYHHNISDLDYNGFIKYIYLYKQIGYLELSLPTDVKKFDLFDKPIQIYNLSGFLLSSSIEYLDMGYLDLSSLKCIYNLIENCPNVKVIDFTKCVNDINKSNLFTTQDLNIWEVNMPLDKGLVVFVNEKAVKFTKLFMEVNKEFFLVDYILDSSNYIEQIDKIKAKYLLLKQHTANSNYIIRVRVNE